MNDWRELKIMNRAMASVVRVAIVYQLAHRDAITVTDLTGMLGISQPLVSWHLRKLRRASLIQTQRVGRQVYCSLNAFRYQQWLQRMGQLVDPTAHLEPFPIGDALIEMETETESIAAEYSSAREGNI